jgi:hypothetical protein
MEGLARDPLVRLCRRQLGVVFHKARHVGIGEGLLARALQAGGLRDEAGERGVGLGLRHVWQGGVLGEQGGPPGGGGLGEVAGNLWCGEVGCHEVVHGVW